MTGAAAPGRRTRSRRGEGELLRAQILETTERLLIATGDVDALSIRAVAEAVGVTPPAIYLHFSEKRELIFEVCAASFAELDRVMEEAAAGSPDPIESLLLRGRAAIRIPSPRFRARPSRRLMRRRRTLDRRRTLSRRI